jgi:hypothetical protein
MALVAAARNNSDDNLRCELESAEFLPLDFKSEIEKQSLNSETLLNVQSFVSFVTCLVVSLAAVWLCPNPALAQVVTWTKTDINTGSTGSFSYGAATPPTYTITGSGTGVAFFDDSFTFVGTPAFGALTIQGQVVSQTNTGNGALAGLCIRNSTLPQYAYSYVLAVTPGNGLVFYRRYQTGGNSTIATAAGAAPLYLKLARDGSVATGYTVSAYYGTDGVNWTLLASASEVNTNPMPNKFYAGFVVSSSVNGATQSTAVFDHVSYLTSVPQQSSNLLLWLRSDVGVTTSSGAVTSWADQSGNGNNATQGTGANRPALTAGSANSGILPSITFNGSTDFANLSAGASVFAIVKPSSSVATGVPFVCGNTSNSDALIAKTVGTNAALYAYNSSTSSNVITSSNPISTSNFHVLEATFTPGQSAGTGVGKIYVNGSLEATATNLVQNLNNTSRATNLVGAGIGLTEHFGGDICEILVYSSPLSDTQRHSLESYFLSKYNVGATPTLDTPTITPSSGVYLPQQKFILDQSQNAVVHFTTNGVTPTDSDLWFYNNQSFWMTYVQPYFVPAITKTTTIKAIAKAPFFNDSAVASATFEMDPSTSPIPRSGLVQWLRASNITTSGSNVTNWNDISGSRNDASNGSNQPTLVANAINGHPAVNFSGSQFLQAPAGFSTFTSGLSAILVAKPVSVSAGARLFDYGNGATSDNIIMSLPSSTGLTFSTYNSSTSSSATASTGVTLGNFQLLESLYNGSNTANLFVNASSSASSTSMQTLNNLVRSGNYLGQDNSGGNRYNGQIAEMLLWNRQLTSAERTAVEGYLLSKYLLLSSNSVANPTFSTSSTTFTEPSQVAIAAPTGSKIYITTDGSTPSTSSLEYSKPLFITHTQTVKAIAAMNGLTSGVATATYTLDSTKWPAPSVSDTRTLELKQQLPNVGIPNDASQP